MVLAPQPWPGAEAQLVRCLPSIAEALGLSQTLHKPGLVEHPCTPALRIWRQEDQEFRANLSYRVSLRSAFAT